MDHHPPRFVNIWVQELIGRFRTTLPEGGGDHEGEMETVLTDLGAMAGNHS